MEAIKYINEFSGHLIKVVLAAGIFAGIVESVKLTMSDDEYDIVRHKRNIRKIIIGSVVGVAIKGFIDFLFKNM